jgi:hypothetical protein
MRGVRSLLSVFLLMTLVAGLSTFGCGTHGKAGTGGKGGGGGATAGSAGATAGTDGGAGATGTGGAVDAAADAPNELPVADAATDGDASDGATDAGASDAIDAADAAPEAAPRFDAGLGCDPPPLTEAPLVPAAEGVPATGLVLWLRGDRGIYMTPGAGAVCAWADQSAQHGVLTASGSNPFWMPLTVGGQAAVHFTTTSAALTTGGVLGIAPKSGRTFVAVQKLVTLAARFSPIMQGQAGTPGTYLHIDTNPFQTAGSREGVYATNNAYDSSLATSTSARVHIYTLSTVVPGTPVLSAIDYRVNGAAQTLTRTAGGFGNGNLEDFSGANFTAVGAEGGDALVAEVLVYDHALSADEKTAVEAALKTRYGIP